MSVQITTPIPSPEEVADSLGLSAERRKFLSDLASGAKRQRSTTVHAYSGIVQTSSHSRKRSKKKAA